MNSFDKVSAQLEGPDYRELYSAYSGTTRKPQVEPRILFEILVCAYAMGEYSTRKVERLCRENVQFLLLLNGHTAPYHTTIARFRGGKKTGQAIVHLFEQYNQVPERAKETYHEAVYIDGTKIESKANRYTFVWRKTIERKLKKIREKLREYLPETEGYMTLKKVQERIAELEQQIEEAQITVTKGRGHHKPKILRLRDEVKKQAERWEVYEEKRRIPGEGRNSYAKTDPDATFMHMKEDHMRNGQLKPRYNFQFAVNSEYITGIGVFPNRTDYATLPPMPEKMAMTHGKRYSKVVADSWYEAYPAIVIYRHITN